ncbi:hypothetical protein Aspvir_001271 [Aspergillus viridinutans]|uniref:Uncharacterized protein n=1 Tax=Aspergillus viridinutans TaxID=75553 RepID=A0A9P3BSE9_ASPVI|nr:uncharacterized protein Aspvir_001271 [Aspergillus viridinutans]GIJ99145.1 hypothetical protein Aspvir_001271 [Aspergillus viridinutans]
MSWDYDSQANCGGSWPASHAPRESELAKRCLRLRSARSALPSGPLPRLEELLVAVASVNLAFEASAGPAVQVIDSPAASVTSLFGAFFRGLNFQRALRPVGRESAITGLSCSHVSGDSG